MSEVHPLDREDDDASISLNTEANETNEVAKRRLIRMVWVAVIVGGLLVISSVAMNAVVYDSPPYWVAFGINRFFMLLLLLAFAGMLAIYQRSNIQRLIASMRNARVSAKPTTSLGAEPYFRQIFSAYSALIAANTLLLLLVWLLVMISTTIGPSLGQSLLMIGSRFFPGLLVCMIVWNRGFMRAYAIGALTTHLCSTAVFLQSIGSLQQIAARPYTTAIDLGWHWTIVLLGGLVPATYVLILQKMRGDQVRHPNEPPKDPPQVVKPS